MFVTDATAKVTVVPGSTFLSDSGFCRNTLPTSTPELTSGFATASSPALREPLGRLRLGQTDHVRHLDLACPRRDQDTDRFALLELRPACGVLAQNIAFLYLQRGLPAFQVVAEAGRLDLRDSLGLGQSDDFRHGAQLGPGRSTSVRDDHVGDCHKCQDEDGRKEPGPRAPRAARFLVGFDDGRLLIRRPTHLDRPSRPGLARYCCRRGGGHHPGRFFREAVPDHLCFALLHPPHIVQHGLGGEVAVYGSQTQRANDDRFELIGDERIESPRGRRRIVDIFPGDPHRVVSLKGEASGDHLVHHHAQRVEVRSGVYRSPQGRPGHAEVGDHHVAIAIDDDVLRLDITVDDVLPVSEAERLEDLQRYRCDDVGAEGSVFEDDRLERSARQVLHSYVISALRLPPVADLDDVRVVKAGCVAGLAAESLEELLVVRKARGKHLESNLPAENPVVGKVDIGYAAATELAHDLITIVE